MKSTESSITGGICSGGGSTTSWGTFNFLFRFKETVPLDSPLDILDALLAGCGFCKDLEEAVVGGEDKSGDKSLVLVIFEPLILCPGGVKRPETSLYLVLFTDFGGVVKLFIA